jgi:hypothetical protein
MRDKWFHPRNFPWLLIAIAASVALLVDRVQAAADDDDDGGHTQLTLTVAPFTEVETKGDVELEIHANSDEPSIHVEGGNLHHIDASVEGDKLVIDGRGASNVKVVLHLAELRRVKTSGSSTTELHGVDGDTLDLVLDGSGGIDVDGTAHSVNIEVNGSGNVDAEQLACDRAEVTLNGSGYVAVAEPKAITATIHGSGRIVHGGSPQVTQRIAGSGEVAARR